MRNPIVVAAALVLAIAAPAYAQTSSELTQADVDRALAERTAAANSLSETTARFEIAVADEEIAREHIADLARSVAALELDIADRRVEVLELVRSRYMSGGPNGTERIFAAETFEDLPVQSEYYQLLGERDLSVLRGLEAAEAVHKEQQQILDESLTAQVALVAEITALRDDILKTLEDADTAYNAIAIAYSVQEEKKRIAEEARLKREAEERAAAAAAAAATSTTIAVKTATTATTTTTTPPPPSPTTTSGTTTTTTIPNVPPPIVTSGKTCPVNAATTFSDTWGAGRSGGRSHKGVDMMAVRNAPLAAIESGTIERTSNSSLGGISIYLTGNSGAKYYYAHLESLASGVKGGLVVNVGDTIGFNGSSGNAPDYLPHLHFQYAPPGSDWINPYPLVKELCG
ncbi:MAG: M23 family metallopeptidase [Acidimicrobiia bacterium]|nr:M23 family metallopeptidase [Acidimicrobiia bacterium]